MHRLLFTVLTTAVSATAQDLLGIDFAGQVYAIDSATGVGATLAPAGTVPGCNALCRWRGVLVASSRIGSGATLQHRLVSVSDRTGVIGTIESAPDVRGLAADAQDNLYMLVEGTPDRLVVRNAQGQIVRNVPTSHAGLQSLAFHQGTLYGFDLTVGLVRIDPITGQSVDVSPLVAVSHPVQCLASVVRNGLPTLIGGQHRLVEISPVGGTQALLAGTGGSGFADLRGIEARLDVVLPFGQGCAGAQGTVVLTATGQPRPNQVLTTTSTHHAPGAPGLLAIGLSRTTHLGTPLPASIDPILGTQGCALLVSVDVTLFFFANTQGALQIPITVPPSLTGAVFHLQHVAFEPVPGETSWSNALEVRVRAF